jgi:hypothetical protein
MFLYGLIAIAALIGLTMLMTPALLACYGDGWYWKALAVGCTAGTALVLVSPLLGFAAFAVALAGGLRAQACRERRTMIERHALAAVSGALTRPPPFMHWRRRFRFRPR